MLIITFLISGMVIATLVVLKALEMRTGKQTFFLRLISRGDERLRSFSNDASHSYSVWKEEAHVFLTRQLPLRARNEYYKAVELARGKVLHYVGDIRNSKFVRKNEGISEFLKSISDTEKGSGEINEEFMQDAPEAEQTFEEYK